MRKPFFFCLTVLLLATGLRSQAQSSEDRCRDILVDGVRDEFSDLRNRNVKSAFQSALCSDIAQSGNNSSGAQGGFSVPIAAGLIGANGGYNQSQISALRNKYCAQTSTSLSDEDYSNMMKRVSSAKVVDAWSACMVRIVNPDGGLQSLIEEAGNQLIFRVRWNPRFNVSSVTVADFYASNAHCASTLLQPGSTIGTEWQIQHCVRLSNDPVIITLQATNQMGSTEQKLPALATKTEVPAPVTTKDKCMGGSASACSTLSTETRSSCNFDAACISRAQCWSDKSRAITLVKYTCDHQNAEACTFQRNNVARQVSMDCDDF